MRSFIYSLVCRNIVGRNMLRAFGHPVVTVVGPSLKMIKFEPPTPSMSQHWGRNKVSKRAQHVAPNNVVICCVEMLRSFGQNTGLT